MSDNNKISEGNYEASSGATSKVPCVTLLYGNNSIEHSVDFSFVRWVTDRNYFYECGAWYDLEEKVCDTDEQLYNLFLKWQKQNS